jgi:2,3-bisphosphoglycerate-dependent phosphoglycerate mutase
MFALLILVCVLATGNAFVPALKPSLFQPVTSLRGGSSSSTVLPAKYQVVLLRHGESTWNDANRFTGWADVPLSDKGLLEAAAAGALLKKEGFEFDTAYTSVLQRAIHTLWLTLKGMDLLYIPVHKHWRLNERHYGGLQGLNKQETVEVYGKEKVMEWRRSYDIPPPECETSSEHYPGNDKKYADVPRADLPRTESLKLTEERFLKHWKDTLVPAIKSGKKILIAAHGNTLRALVKHLDNISSQDITGLNIPTGAPLVYDLDENMVPVQHKDAIGPLRGRYLGDQDEIKKRIGAVAAQTK